MKRRWGIALLIGMMLTAACAQAAQPYPREQVHAIVEQLFVAAAGTTHEAELAAREGLTAEEDAARSAMHIAHREKTLPWLKAAFTPEGKNGLTMKMPSLIPEATPSEPTEPAWTLEDGYAALMDNAHAAPYLSAIAELGGTDAESCMAVTQAVCRQWMAEVDHDALSEINGHYACWIYGPGVNIDYPIVQGSDNEYYLYRMFNRKQNASGALFIDFRNLPGFMDPNTLVYGHHMRNEGMFGLLDEYGKQAFFDAHPFMLILSPEEIDVLQIFAGYTTSKHDHCYDIAISDEEDLRLFIETALQKTDFVSGVEVGVSDHLVTLSTCAYAFEGARYIAIGRLEPIWTQPKAWMLEMEQSAE